MMRLIRKRSSFILESKSALRRHYRHLCHAISPEERNSAGLKAANVLAKHAAFLHSHRIACYLSYKHEFNSASAIKTIWQHQKECYVPIVSKDSKILQFVRYQAGDPLHANKYSILEPTKHDEKIAGLALDMVLLPLVAFDAQGNRLGAGGGYYDQTFQMPHAEKKPILIGLAFAAQEAAALPVDTWDVKLDGVITELGFKHF